MAWTDRRHSCGYEQADLGDRSGGFVIRLRRGAGMGGDADSRATDRQGAANPLVQPLRPAARLGSDHPAPRGRRFVLLPRSEEHTSELQSLMRNSYADFWLQKKTKTKITTPR